MFGSIGMQEIVLILFILLLLFGAKRLPELGESLGKGIREFKRGVSEIKEDIESDDERKGGE
jgi:sec-independent protein translocase protein TatA